MAKARLIAHIDMNSYFASVSQEIDPNLRNIPVGVLGKGKGTVIIAASKEAKKFKVKTGTLRNDAEKLCPGIKFVQPNFSAYIHYTSIFLQILNEFSPIIEPFSIDEAFVDLTDSYLYKINKNPLYIGYSIKKRMHERLGNIITSSIGIADNKLMAKFASDLKKPDGLVYLTPYEYINILDKSQLMDLCGIGHRTYKRLNLLNIYNFKDLRNTDYAILRKEFGPVKGRFLYLASRGLDYTNVDNSKYQSAPKSISNGETFIENIYGTNLITQIYKLSEKVSLRLRNKKLFAKRVSIHIKDDKFNTYSFDISLNHATNRTLDIYNAARKNIPNNFISRFLNICAYDFSNSPTLDLFESNEKGNNLQLALDQINKKFGNFSIFPGSIDKNLINKENPIDIPYSGFDNDAKLGIDLTTIIKKDLNIIKRRTTNLS